MKNRIVNRLKLLNPNWVKSRLAILLIIIGIIVLVVSLLKIPEKIQHEEEEITGKSQGMHIYVDDLYSGRILIPDFDIELNAYDSNQFSVNQNGYCTYPEAKIGVDVSVYQGDIDWAQVKADGIDFAIIRAGFRGTTEGGLFDDELFAENVEAALANDLEVGVYFFSQAISEEEAKAEADFVLSKIKDYKITYPIVFDWEIAAVMEDGTVPRTQKVNTGEISSFAAAFCKEIEAAGKIAAFYTNKHLGYEGFNLKALEKYEMWYAEYQQKPSFHYQFDMWQFTETGKVPGISGDVDVNLSFKDYAKS